MPSEYHIALYSGNSNTALSRTVASCLNKKISQATVSRFNDNEIHVQLDSSVRGQDVFIIQSSGPPNPSENLMEILVMIDAVRRSSAKRITAVLPYFGFGRQDRRPWSARVPITARLVANMLTTAGADRILTIDLHADQIQGFFNIPVDNVYASPIFTQRIAKKIDNPMVVSPDVGGVVRARALAKQLNAELAIIDKRRPSTNVSEVMNIIGEVEGRNCVIFDDIVDTAGTLCKAAGALKEGGAISVYACCTHGVLSKDAVHKVEDSALDGLLVSNTIDVDKKASMSTKIDVLCVSQMLADSISRIHQENSIQSMYPASMG